MQVEPSDRPAHCPECGNAVSTQAAYCFACGRALRAAASTPQKRAPSGLNRRALFVVGALLLLGGGFASGATTGWPTDRSKEHLQQSRQELLEQVDRCRAAVDTLVDVGKEATEATIDALNAAQSSALLNYSAGSVSADEVHERLEAAQALVAQAKPDVDACRARTISVESS